jgi:hypothetical protein
MPTVMSPPCFGACTLAALDIETGTTDAASAIADMTATLRAAPLNGCFINIPHFESPPK